MREKSRRRALVCCTATRRRKRRARNAATQGQGGRMSVRNGDSAIEAQQDRLRAAPADMRLRYRALRRQHGDGWRRAHGSAQCDAGSATHSFAPAGRRRRLRALRPRRALGVVAIRSEALSESAARGGVRPLHFPTFCGTLAAAVGVARAAGTTAAAASAGCVAGRCTHACTFASHQHNTTRPPLPACCRKHGGAAARSAGVCPADCKPVFGHVRSCSAAHIPRWAHGRARVRRAAADPRAAAEHHLPQGYQSGAGGNIGPSTSSASRASVAHAAPR